MEIVRKQRDLLFIIDDSYDHKEILDLFHALRISRKTIHLLLQNKDYTLNGQFVPYHTLMRTGDHLQVKAYASDDGLYQPADQAPEIIYEDDYLLIVNKPSGLPVYPAALSDKHSLAHQVAYYYLLRGYDLPVRFIHRLDDDTSGLVIFVKCALFQPLMDHMLEAREIHRHYFALVSGQFPDHQEYVIDQPLGRDRHNSKKMRTGGHITAVTRYHMIQNYHDYALVECALDTGRRHQIRVHMASIGHPVLGDKLYNKHPGKIEQLALHAYRVEMIHPVTGEKLRITVPLPKAFDSYID